MQNSSSYTKKQKVISHCIYSANLKKINVVCDNCCCVSAVPPVRVFHFLSDRHVNKALPRVSVSVC